LKREFAMFAKFIQLPLGVALLTVATAVIAADPPMWTSAEKAARDKIMDSPAFQNAGHAFNEWLSVQQTYDTKTAARMQRDLVAQIDRMDAEHLKLFLAGMEEKLKVVNSAEGRDARLWVAQYMAVASKGKANELRKKLPDLAKMTPAQMELALQEFEQKRQSQRQFNKDFEQGRANQAAAIQRYNQSTEAARQRALDRATYDSGGYGNYFPSGGYARPYGSSRW
jgi:hypothetical protein